MVGLALGSGWSLRAFCSGRTGAGFPLLFWLQLLAAISSLLVCALLTAFASVDNRMLILLISHFVFPFLALLAGLMGGIQFPLASTFYFSEKRDDQANPGLVYGLDILGAWSASLLLSIVFFPVYGLFPSSLLVAAVNSGPLLLIGIACVRAKRGL